MKSDKHRQNKLSREKSETRKPEKKNLKRDEHTWIDRGEKSVARENADRGVHERINAAEKAKTRGNKPRKVPEKKTKQICRGREY